MKNGTPYLKRPGVPGGMRAYLQNLMKSNSLLKHLSVNSVKRTSHNRTPHNRARKHP